MKKRITKHLAMLLVGVMAFSSLSACGGGNTAETTKAELTKPAPQTGTETVKSATGEAKETEAPTEAVVEGKTITAEEYAALTPEELIELFIKDKKNISVEEYLALMDTSKFAERNDDGTFAISRSITGEALKLLNADEEAVLPEPQDYIPTMLSSEEPAVRFQAVSYFGSFLGLFDKDLSPVKELLEKETDPGVLYNAIEELRSYYKKDEDVKSFLFRMTENESTDVCIRAIYGIGIYGEGDADAKNRIMELVDHEEPKIREAALYICGDLDDADFLPILETVILDPEQSDFHSAAGKSLETLWKRSENNNNEDAYKILLNYISTAPISKNTPYWTVVNYFTFSTNRDSFQKWKETAPYFDTAAVEKAMVALYTSEDARKDNYMATVAAIETLTTIGSKEDLQNYKSTIDALSDDVRYNNVREKYYAALEG